MTAPSREPLSSREVAQRLGLKTVKTVHRWRKRGWLEGAQLPNGQWRFGAAQVDEILANGGTPRARSELALDIEAHVMAQRQAAEFRNRLSG